MPKKDKQSKTIKKSAPAKAKRGKGARNRQSERMEPTSGAQSSSLDPNRSSLLTADEENSLEVKVRQSGDAQGLSQMELADSESVEELVEEGQGFEGEVVAGIENAPGADQGNVRTHGSANPAKKTPAYKNRNRL